MRHFMLLGCFMLMVWAPVKAQEGYDDAATLQWVQKQALKIESLLHGAILHHDYPTLLLRMAQCSEMFATVTHAGLYCHEARAAAELGRRQCNLISDDLSSDMNSFLIRATHGRALALRMHAAAEKCLAQRPEPVAFEATYSLSDIFAQDVALIGQYLDQAVARRDFHQLAVKLEQAMYLLREVELMAGSLDDCERVKEAAMAANKACLEALLADAWEQSLRHVSAARLQLEQIALNANCRR